MRIRSLLLGIICGTSFLSAQNLLVLPVTGQFDRESDATTLDGLYHEAMQAKFKGNVMAPVAGAYCGAMNCAIQIANENGADAVVYSTVSRLGTKWVFSSTIMNTGGGRSYTQSFAAGSIEDMAGSPTVWRRL